ncbi:hypothetical protein N9988_00010 [bacterium]|nr:hypothetical protein [bacterium]
MKIVVSKKAMDKNFQTKVDATIYMAKQCAEQGQTSFYMNIPSGSGYSKYDLISRVEELTENTVYTEIRPAVSGNSIKFSIAQEGRINGSNDTLKYP